ncbi:hypothetical protein pqer_cds_739 [Pandoravirus quercus]|uniref:Uncharacterized protein n=1 Tax=Pandoravirus quercus TaxID=2107709 RepID=A0A2U7U9P1_9VIRU|nr:hypothetical protein pqer_cds_739 [Pandoravirus quercus]AVK75161.1 hypothetical protein pqer_cds_739 [Pandoravirus quercus]
MQGSDDAARVLLQIGARAEGPTLLEMALPVDGLCRGSHYFAALLRGGFRESIGDHSRHPGTRVVLPLPQCAPWGLDAVLAHVAGVADRPQLGVGLLYWPTLIYLGADACLRQYADAWREMTDVWPSHRPACPHNYAYKAVSVATTPGPMPEPAVLLSVYACAILGDVGMMRAHGQDVYERLGDPSATLFGCDRLWSLYDAPHDEPDYCEFGHGSCGRARREWTAAHLRLYGDYRAALLGACDQSLTRLQSALTKSPSCSTDCLDMCVGGDPALLSLATVTALRDWHRAISAASPHTSSPYALSLCNLLDPACAARLIVRYGGEAQDEDDPVANDNDVEKDRDPLDGRQAKRRRSADTHMAVTVDSKATFEAALREAFPRAADVVLRLVGFRVGNGADGHRVPSGAVLAGGCVVEAVQQEPLRARLPDSDMDLWVIGEDSRKRRDAFGHVIETLFRELPDHKVTVRGSVVTFALPDTVAAREKVQVIYTDGCCGGDVISAFDLTHAAAYYDGQTVWATWDCAWSLVSRCIDAIPAGGGAIRPVRLDRAVLKGFQPTEALVAMAALADGPDAAIKSPQKEQHTIAAGEYADADAVLAAFTYRPIDARDYDAHLALPESHHVTVDDPIYLTMPPLYMPFEALCNGCTQSRHVGRAYHRECTCNLALRVRLDLPRYAGDDGGLSKSNCLSERAAAFRRRIEDVESAIRHNLKWGPLYKDVPNDEIWEMLWDSVARRNDPDPTHPGLLRMQCLGTTTVTSALTGQMVDLKGMEGVWIDGRVAFRRVGKVHTAITPVLAAAALRVYPPSFQAVVHGLDEACLG